MKVTLNLDDELQHALELHLEKEISVQSYIKASLKFFKDMYKQEESGKMVGFGDKNKFETYNTKASPWNYLNTER